MTLQDRLGLPTNPTPEQIAPLLGGQYDADARFLIRVMIRKFRLESVEMHVTTKKAFKDACRVRDENFKKAEARFELACSYAALLESP